MVIISNMQWHMRRQQQQQQQQQQQRSSSRSKASNNNTFVKDDCTVTTMSSNMSSNHSVVSAITCPFEQEEAAARVAAELRQQRKNQRYSRSSHIMASSSRRTSAPAHMLQEDALKSSSGAPGDGLSRSLHGTPRGKSPRDRRSLLVRSKPGPAFGRSSTSTTDTKRFGSPEAAALGRSKTQTSDDIITPSRPQLQRTGRRHTSSAMDLASSLAELPIMDDESLSDFVEQQVHPYRSQSARNLMANIDDSDDVNNEGYDSFVFRQDLNESHDYVSDMDLLEGNLTALDVSRVSHGIDQSQNDQDDDIMLDDSRQTRSSGERFKDNVEYLARKSTFAKNMEFITVRGSYLAQNIDYLQERTNSLCESAAGAVGITMSTTRNAAGAVGSTIGNTVTNLRPNKQESEEESEEKRIEGEIRSFFDVGTKVEVLEVMYDPDQVAKVLNKMHAEGAKQKVSNKKAAGGTRRSSGGNNGEIMMLKKTEETKTTTASASASAAPPKTNETPTKRSSSWGLLSIFTPGSAAVECRTAAA